ncbi:MAG: hypothetical protein M1817_004277 [Caeruleum heppii]|nr:MAG: hypothetical protein M1817_004277 [Caeruleum heppii]
MASPAKRRKKNDYNSSPSTTRSLDHFFGKQIKGKNLVESLDKTNGSIIDVQAPEESKQDSNEGLTDEELARKLHDELNGVGSDAQNGLSATLAENEGRPGIEKGAGTTDKAPALEPGEPSIAYPSPGGPTEPATAVPESTKDPPAARDHSTKTLSLQSNASAEDTVSSTLPFDENPLTFNPSKYIPELHAHWASSGGEAPYAILTRCFVLVNSTQSRIKIVDTLTNCLRLIIEADPDSLLPAVWLATNSIAPPYVSMELGLGGSAISKALKKVCGLDNQGLKTLYNKYGDAGDVAFEAKKRQTFTLRKPKSLSMKSVYQSLVKVANSKGNGSVEFKQRIVERLVQDARGAEESRYIVRTLVQHLRIGAVKTTMLIALSRAFYLSRPPSADFPITPQSELLTKKKDELAEIFSKGEELVKTCYARRPNYNDIVPALLEVGLSDELLLRCGLGMHIPLRPMLGSITRDMAEMLVKLQGRDFSCEYKYDGQRAQVHCDDTGKVSIFSRHLELMTDKYPDLVAIVPEIRGEGVSSFIMEGEVVAIDRDKGELKTFQTLAGRGRKDVAIGDVKVDVCLFSFDLMYLNGEELLDRPFRERRELLRGLFKEVPGRFTWVKNIDASSKDEEKVLEFFRSATDIKCEGIMVKVLDNLPNPALEPLDLPDPTHDEDPPAPPTPSKLTKKTKTKSKTKEPPSTDQDKEKNSRRKPLLATYSPDKRLDSWLKVKKDYSTSSSSSSQHTLDLIPIAAWHGSGRKASWWSPLLLACRSTSPDDYSSDESTLSAVCKCISGFTDAFYIANKFHYAFDSVHTHRTKPAYIDYPRTAPQPDIWFEPQEVWEIAFADVTLSPVYTAGKGLVSEERGLSLRFPRFLRKREGDKGVEEASTAAELAEVWRRQGERVVRGEAKDDDNGGGGGGGGGMKGVRDDDGEADAKSDKEAMIEDDGAM